MATSSSTCQKPTLQEVIDNIGFGRVQIMSLFIGGSVWLADGAEILLISSVTKEVSDDWHLTPLERGSIVTIVFVGVLIGNAASGPYGDSFGRYNAIVLSFFLIFIFSIVSSFTISFRTMAFVRLCVGIAFGIGQPAWTVLGSELSPAKWRITMATGTASLWIVGEMYAILLILWNDPAMEDLDWRWLLRAGAMPSLVCFIAALIWLPKSPMYLSLHGKHDEAKRVLEWMRHCNKVDHVSVEFTPTAKKNESSSWRALKAKLGIVFQGTSGHPMLYTTLTVTYSTFVMNFIYYGAMYSFPQVLPNIVAKGSAAMQLLLGTCWEMVGLVIALILGPILTRKDAIKVYLLMTTGFFLLFCMGSLTQSKHTVKPANQVMLLTSFYGIKCTVILGSTLIYQYASEVYPTAARITGVAFAIAVGRTGSMLAPLVYETSVLHFGGYHAFFLSCVSLGLLNLLLVHFLPYETAQAPLQDQLDSDPEESQRAKYGATSQEIGIANSHA